MSLFMLQLKVLLKKSKDDDVFAMASQLAYSLILSVFPFLIVFISIMGNSINPDKLAIYIEKLIPETSFTLVTGVLNEVINTKTTTSFVSIGLIFALWSASQGFSAVIRCLNKAYGEKERRNFVKLKAFTLLCTISLVIILIFCVFVLVFGDIIGEKIKDLFSLTNVFMNIWNLLRYIFMVLILTGGFFLLYHYTPSRKLTWRECIPGTIFTSISWFIACIIFSFYVNNFSNYSKIYGSLGGLIALMIWLFMISAILLLGGEINATWALNEKELVKY